MVVPSYAFEGEIKSVLNLAVSTACLIDGWQTIHLFGWKEGVGRKCTTSFE